MKKIKALKNFGFKTEHVEPGTILEVDPNEFGDTYNDFLEAGLFEEVTEPAPEPTPEPEPQPAAPKAKKPSDPAPITEVPPAS